MNKLKDPLFWTTIVATLVNLALYLINRKTFRLLYEKPKIIIQQISLHPREPDGMGGLVTDTFINVIILNPSSTENLIINRKLRRFPFGPMLISDEVNIELPVFGRKNMHISLHYAKALIYNKKYFLLTLTDIKGRKTKKLFRLTNTVETKPTKI
jgi:hypothetical protein